MNHTPETVKQSGDVCSHKLAVFFDNWLRKMVQNPQKIVGEYIQPGNIVIDIGCGPGFFTKEMARLVGDHGHVFAIDVQEEMLNHVRRKTRKKGLLDRVTCHKSPGDRIGLDIKEKADFMLAFYMVHETPDTEAFLSETKTLLKKGGKFLISEPRGHVKQDAFVRMVQLAKKIGFSVTGYPEKKGGRSVLLTA